ncbi:MAG: PQQ-binding-like beta-propeller repeat protein [Planctomycetota bacterium]|nr:PQQ-binding-like beta-propeller repeat protein [Planctomycetota bacterium]MDA1248831.1 PQQ-binding-like beta-propeller repeat protein [Planctomycetota bacterium]
MLRFSAAVFALCFAILAVAAPLSAADEWPQFQGPRADGHSSATGLPLTWSETENVAWKAAIPGNGHSSPVISGNEIWLTTAVQTKLTDEQKKEILSKVPNSNGLEIAGRVSLRAVCVARDSGRITHNIELFEVEKPEPIHALNSYASPSPIIQNGKLNGKLFCHFGTYGTCCVDTASAKVEWKNTDHHVDHQNGPGASPSLWEGVIILNFDGIDSQFIAGLDKRTGETLWTTSRSGTMSDRAEFRKTYSTATVLEDPRGSQVISPGADWVYSYDPASGRELWRASYGMLGFSTVPRPLIWKDLCILTTSFIRPRIVAVKYDGSGDVSKTHVVWTKDGQLPSKPSMLIVEDRIYFISDKGIGMCLDVVSGEEIWKERVDGAFSASPLYADGRMYFFDQAGKTTVLAPGAEYKKLAENKLDGGFMASPAVAGQALFLRTESHLYRIEK